MIKQSLGHDREGDMYCVVWESFKRLEIYGLIDGIAFKVIWITDNPVLYLLDRFNGSYTLTCSL